MKVYFKFTILEKKEINNLTKIISIDNVVGNNVYAYANEEEFNQFLKLGYKYEVLKNPGDVGDVHMSSSLEEIESWDTYPTYDGYVNMMYQFEANYPSICKVVDAGNTVQGRKILFVKISDNVNENEAEPQCMLTSSMHGDETTGYVLMLRLIDSLLSSYGTNARITNLVDNIEIWINPAGNPDGTYHGGNSTVNGATRYNANGKDINRNFPDPESGPYPTGAWQPETIAMMNIAQQNNFILSVNFHGGVEVVNYPWDTWPRLHPDDSWFHFISRQYADTVHAHSPASYMTYLDNGITNGYAWYEVDGGRQDYFTYFNRGREVTIELSNIKLVTPSQLPLYWEYNKRSFLNYIQNCLYGIRGIVTDTIGNPVKAFIKINGHDFDSSEVYSDSINGDYYRLIYAGTYNLTFSAPAYFDTTITNVSVSNFSSTILNVELKPLVPVPVELISFLANINGNNVNLMWVTATEKNNRGFEIERCEKSSVKNQKWGVISFIEGNGTITERNYYSFIDNEVNPGKYLYRLKQIDFNGQCKYSQEVEVNISSPSFTLEQNYPNPFNPNTIIGWQIPVDNFITLKVFDVLGNEVAVLINEEMAAGSYKTEFDARNLSSGVYLYKLIAGNFSITKKMLLTK